MCIARDFLKFWNLCTFYHIERLFDHIKATLLQYIYVPTSDRFSRKIP